MQPLGRHGPIPPWIPKGAVRKLAEEFQVSRGTVHRDIKAIEAEELKAFDARPLPPRQRIRDPRFRWARERERTMSHRLTVHIPADLYHRLTVHGEVSQVIRRAVEGYLETQSPHTTHACALTVVGACDPDTADRLVTTAEALGKPLAEVIGSLLLIVLRPPPSTKEAWNHWQGGPQGEDTSPGERGGG